MFIQSDRAGHLIQRLSREAIVGRSSRPSRGGPAPGMLDPDDLHARQHSGHRSRPRRVSVRRPRYKWQCWINDQPDPLL